VAGRQYLNQISAQIRDDAVGTLSALLRSKDDEDDGRAAKKRSKPRPATW
jgi:hypothetical protein